MASSSKFSSLPSVPGTDPSRCVLDLFRTAIAQKLTKAFPDLTLEKAYEGVDYGKKGEDFTVALPRFRLPGKVDALAKQLLDSVRLPHIIPRSRGSTDQASLHPTTMSRTRRRTRRSCTSRARRRR
jgi:hypothetical protein